MAFLKKSLLLVLFLGFVSLYICEEDLTKSTPKDTKAAPASVVAANCFKDSALFQLARQCSKSSNQVMEVFEILDRDGSQFLEEEDIELFQGCPKPDARALNDAKCLMKAGDTDGDGRIGLKEFRALMKA